MSSGGAPRHVLGDLEGEVLGVEVEQVGRDRSGGARGGDRGLRAALGHHRLRRRAAARWSAVARRRQLGGRPHRQGARERRVGIVVGRPFQDDLEGLGVLGGGPRRGREQGGLHRPPQLAASARPRRRPPARPGRSPGALVRQRAGQRPRLGPEHPAREAQPREGEDAQERLLRASSDRVLQDAEPGDLHPHPVAGLQERLRIARHAHAGRGAGGDDVTRLAG